MAINISIVALICGVLGIVGSIIGPFVPYVGILALALAILGIVFGAKGLKIAKANSEPTGMAVAGLVLGIIGTTLGASAVLCVVCGAACFVATGMAAAGL